MLQVLLFLCYTGGMIITFFFFRKGLEACADFCGSSREFFAMSLNQSGGMFKSYVIFDQQKTHRLKKAGIKTMTANFTYADALKKQEEFLKKVNALLAFLQNFPDEEDKALLHK